MPKKKKNPLDRALDRLQQVTKKQNYSLAIHVPAQDNDDDVVIDTGLIWARRRIRTLEEAILAYTKNPGCNLPAKKKALQRLMAAVIEEEKTK
jgi:hypothetical protein